MKSERLKVLSMLDEGKISAEEATTLLSALNCEEESGDCDEFADTAQEKFHRAADKAKTEAAKFGEKCKDAYKKAEPRLKKMGQTILEKTASVVDTVSKSLHDTIEKQKAPCCANEDCECGDDCDCTEDNCCCEETNNHN